MMTRISLSPLRFVYVNTNEMTFPFRLLPAVRAELILNDILGATAHVVVAGPANV